MEPTALHNKGLVVQPVGRRPMQRRRNRCEVDYTRLVQRDGDPDDIIQQLGRRPIVYPLNADGRRVQLK